jgi:Uma2 family endonuclease
MSRITKPPSALDAIDYPTYARFPVPETDWHRDLMFALIQTLATFFAANPRVYVSGNLLVFYEPGNRRRHVSPDVLVVKGVANYKRPNYLIWRERKSLDFVIELTSATTRRQDCETKLALYQDVVRVKEYFQFDPFGDYLDPQLRGYRLRGGVYHPIREVAGRLPSRVLGLHLEGEGRDLRLWNPASGERLQTWDEAQRAAEQARQTAEQARQMAEQARQMAEQALREKAEALNEETDNRRRAEVEVERLRRELDQIRQRP